MGRNRSQGEVRKKILIVGDWVVDDYWVIVNHRSSKGSRTGLMHHLAMHKLEASIRAFCGAGQTASILQKTRRKKESNPPVYEIFGLGLWAKGDDEGLRGLFDPENTKSHNPYFIFKPFKENLPDNVTLLNLGDYLTDAQAKIGTIRAIRTYLKVGNKTTQLQRIDWELQAPSTEGLPKWPIDFGKLSPKLPVVDCVVIKDLGKGIVTDEMINVLLEKYFNVPWFISTKSWRPDWLTNNLGKIPLKLLLIPQIAAQAAIQKDDINIWITNSEYASKKALDELTKLRKSMGEKKTPIFIVLPENFSTLALDLRQDDAKNTGVIFADKTSKFSHETNMASVFFGAVVAQLLENGNIEIQSLIERSLNYTYNWQEIEVKRIDDPDVWDPNSLPNIILDELSSEKPRLQVNNNPFNIKHAKKEWEDAINRSSYGIVQDTEGKEKFEIWRAMAEIDGYVCCVDSKQKNITKLIHAVNSYAKSFRGLGDKIPHARVSQASCLLYAKAGAGKTSLVRKIAENNALRFLPYNITQMNRLIDILDCFDTIVTSSLQDPSKPLLIFVDEINSTLENEDVYKVFLAPLEDGMYIRGGKAFKLPPSFWVFASTQSEDEIKGKSKASDFCSRLTHGMISLDISNPGNPQKQLENVYFGVSMILSIFPDVRQVSSTVLKVLAEDLPLARMREIRHFIEAFENVQYGKISASNIPVFTSDNINIDDNKIKKLVSDESTNLRMIPIVSSAVGGRMIEGA